MDPDRDDPDEPRDASTADAGRDDRGDLRDARDARDAADLARTYYDALDGGDYGMLRAVLAPEFVQRRPDRSFEGRDEFVRFMRDDRPRTDTVHAVDRTYVVEAATEGGTDEKAPNGTAEVAVRGRLLAEDGAAGEREELVAFVDVFRVADGRVTELRTYTR